MPLWNVIYPCVFRCLKSMFIGVLCSFAEAQSQERWVSLSCLCRGAKETLGLLVRLGRLAWLDLLGQLDPQDPRDPRDHQDQDLLLDS